MIKGASHNDGWLFGKQEYIDQLRKFFDDCSITIGNNTPPHIDEEKENLIKDKDL